MSSTTPKWQMFSVVWTGMFNRAALVAIALLVSCPHVFAADATGKGKTEEKKENLGQRRTTDVGKNEELSFQQSKITSQMSELEERMFRLSDALKSLEPENASRLLIGLKYAREELIQLQMKEIQTALVGLKYNDATTEQKQLITKLRRLEQLLLSPDLDFQLQLERLRLLRELMQRLDEAILEEEREQEASNLSAEAEEKLKKVREPLATISELVKLQTEHNQTSKTQFGIPSKELPSDASQPADALLAVNTIIVPEPSAEEVSQLSTAQKRTREKATGIEQEYSDVAEAGLSMDKAVQNFGTPMPALAYPFQEAALASLKKAEDALREEEQKLVNALSEAQFAQMKKDQSGNRKSTDAISEMAVQLGDAGAAARGELTSASGSMTNAESSLGSRMAESASGSQGKAVEALKAARKLLAAEEEKLLNKLRGEIKKRTIEGIVQMLEGQIVIRQSTERLGPRVKEGSKTVLNSVVALSAAEQKLIVIGEGLTALVEETEFGIALPAALRSVTDAMVEVKERLAASDASPDVIANEKQIEEDLQTLLDAMKQLPGNGGGRGNNGGNSPSDRERQLNQIIAELKMVRMLQVGLNRETKDVDQKRAGDVKTVAAALSKKIETLQGRQEDVHDVTERIAIERADDLPMEE